MRGSRTSSSPTHASRRPAGSTAPAGRSTPMSARISGKLRGVALALAVEEPFEARAFVAARLVVDDPAPALVVDEGAVDDDADPCAVRDAVRWYRCRASRHAQQPAAAPIGDSPARARSDALGGVRELGPEMPRAGELAAEGLSEHRSRAVARPSRPARRQRSCGAERRTMLPNCVPSRRPGELDARWNRARGDAAGAAAAAYARRRVRRQTFEALVMRRSARSGVRSPAWKSGRLGKTSLDPRAKSFSRSEPRAGRFASGPASPSTSWVYPSTCRCFFARVAAT